MFFAYFVRRAGALCAAALILSAPARADLPLNIEDLLTAQNRWRLELGAVYANTDRTGVQAGQPVPVQVGPAQFVYLPASIGEARTNSDTFVFTPGLRYGLSAATEIYGRASWLAQSRRIQESGGVRGDSESRFADAWAGINHRLVAEGKTQSSQVSVLS